ncbi:high affinity cGMP-specific 3',5'-cyclic phosphodiesterase 9A [Batrachochytrium salamandrivorans]|nr:high affinity cGMP-specific 3',5'-cyclic phosphodiesterase 9A [Batrachochytrium salamandrivorans]
MNGEEGVVSASISSANSVREVHDIVRSAACIPSTPKVVLKLYSEAGILLPIGPHLQKNNISAPYKLVKHTAKSPGACEIHGSLQNILQSVNEAKAMVEDVDDMKKSVVAVKTKVEQIEKYSDLYAKDRPLQKPATRRVSRVFQAMPLPVNFPAVTLTNDVLEQMKKPTFDIWLFQETELIHLIAHMFTEFGLIETFQIDKERLYMFLTVIKSTYNRNPFHNFQHCFCVTQMMYALLHVTSVHQKFTRLEKLALIVAAIGHDWIIPDLTMPIKSMRALSLLLLTMIALR